jgi:hypothetical protein
VEVEGDYMPTATAGDATNWRNLACNARFAAENMNDPAGWARMIAIEEACKRIAEVAEACERKRMWSRISRFSGGVW